MSFRSDFFDEVRAMNPALPMSPKDSIFINTFDRGLTAQHREISLMREEVEASLSEAADRFAEASDEASQATAAEIRYQAEQVRKEIRKFSDDLTSSIESAQEYLGARVAEVRWAIERNTQVTQQVLDSLWKTHWIDSRQYFDEGVQCYGSGEREFAKERFEKAAEACRTNGFAYQFLGFLSVHDDDQSQALRYFDLAGKFAPNNRHRAIANYHLARAWHAAGNEIESLEKIRLAVSLDRDDLTYKFELVHALMRTGSAQDAIRELRELILLNLKYWTAAAIDRSLDPMRAEINDLLRTMREDERKVANRILGEFMDSINLLKSLPGSSSFEFLSANEWKRSTEVVLKRGTIFAYREAIEGLTTSHRSFLETAIENYKTLTSNSQQEQTALSDEHLEKMEGIRAEKRSLTEQALRVSRDFSDQEAQINRDQNSKEHGYGVVLGCGGCLTILGVMIIGGILFEYFGIKRSTGFADTFGKLILFSPLILLLPVLATARSTIFRLKRRGVRLASRTAALDFQTRIEAAEENAREEEKKGVADLKLRTFELEKLRSIYEHNAALLEKRLETVEVR